MSTKSDFHIREHSQSMFESKWYWSLRDTHSFITNNSTEGAVSWSNLQLLTKEIADPQIEQKSFSTISQDEHPPHNPSPHSQNPSTSPLVTKHTLRILPIERPRRPGTSPSLPSLDPNVLRRSAAILSAVKRAVRASILALANAHADNVGRKIGACSFDAGAVALGGVASAGLACVDVEGVGGGDCGD